jgi:hypothetical protein
MPISLFFHTDCYTGRREGYVGTISHLLSLFYVRHCLRFFDAGSFSFVFCPEECDNGLENPAEFAIYK